MLSVFSLAARKSGLLQFPSLISCLLMISCSLQGLIIALWLKSWLLSTVYFGLLFGSHYWKELLLLLFTSRKTTICVARSASDVKQNDAKVLFASHMKESATYIMCKWAPGWAICVASTKGASDHVAHTTQMNFTICVASYFSTLQKSKLCQTSWPIQRGFAAQPTPAHRAF